MRFLKHYIFRKGQEEHGAILVLSALLLLVIFGFVALAVDTGNAFTARRSSQSVADVAAVGAAIQTIDNDGTDAEKAAEIVAEAQRLVQLNLNVTDWSACSDADHLAFTWSAELSGDSDCISWSEGFRRVRVRVPDRDIETFFARLIGIDTIAVAAAAEVEGLAGGLGGILPFGVLTDAGAGSLLCLKTTNGAQKIPPECEAPTSGDFGYLDFFMFGGVIAGADQNCSGSAIFRLAENIAHGIDHELEPGPPDENDPLVVLDEDKCDEPVTYAGRTVNAADAKTGTAFQQVIFPGFVGGTTSPDFPGRLTVTSGNTTTFGGVSGVDNVGLWEFLKPAPGGCPVTIPVDMTSPARWDPTGYSYPVLDVDSLLICMQWSSAMQPGTAIFEGLKDSPRFGSVPKLWKTWPPGGSANRTFESFVTVYINTLYAGKCNYPDGTCETTFEPGASGVKRNMTATSLDAATAIAIPDGLLEKEDLDALTSLPEIREYLIVE